MKNILYILLLIIFAAGCVFDPVDDDPVVEKKVPNEPSPRNNSINHQTALNLAWEAEDLVKFDVFFDISNPPDSQLASDTTVKRLSVTGLNLDTKYYWRVIGKYDDGTESWGPIWNFKTKKLATPIDGYVLLKHKISTETPSYVNILFQVLDLNGGGIDNLTEDDFYVLENDQLISQLESAMRVKKKEQIEYTLRTILFLDNSSSLSGDLNELKNAAIEFINNMDENQEVALYKFSDGSAIVQDFTSNKNVLAAAVNSLELGFNSTDLYGAAIQAASKWSETFTISEIQQSSIVLFTDGSDTQGKYSLDEALNALAGKRCYTIGLGSDIDTVVLKMLGNSGFFKADSIDSLTDTFLEIQFNLEKFANSFYLLNYLSPKRGDNVVSIKLYVNDNPYTGENSYVYGQFSSKEFYSVAPGLFINSTLSNPGGIEELEIFEDSTVVVKASSFLIQQDPFYLWSSGNSNIAAVSPGPNDNTLGYITATGIAGQQTSIVVTDFNNDMQKIITVRVK